MRDNNITILISECLLLKVGVFGATGCWVDELMFFSELTERKMKIKKNEDKENTNETFS